MSKNDPDDPSNPFPPAITNTAQLYKDIPGLGLIDAMEAVRKGGKPEDAIYAMEARAQKEMVAAAGTQLPVVGILKQRGHRDEESPNKAIMESWGFVFGDVVQGDDIFCHTTMPPGWKIDSTDHSMWTSLVDDKGRKRAGIFYKGAFYDRSAHISLDRRFSVHDFAASGEDKYSHEGPQVGVVLDGETEIWRSEPFVDLPKGEAKVWHASDRAREAAADWLKENYPDFNSVTAYWD